MSVISSTLLQRQRAIGDLFRAYVRARTTNGSAETNYHCACAFQDLWKDATGKDLTRGFLLRELKKI